MIYKLIYIALIIYGIYLYRCKEPWAINFISLMGLALVVSIWESASLNYLDLSAEVRKIETILIGAVRVVVSIILISFAMKWIVIHMKNRFRKKKNN